MHYFHIKQASGCRHRSPTMFDVDARPGNETEVVFLAVIFFITSETYPNIFVYSSETIYEANNPDLKGWNWSKPLSNLQCSRSWIEDFLSTVNPERKIGLWKNQSLVGNLRPLLPITYRLVFDRPLNIYGSLKALWT